MSSKPLRYRLVFVGAVLILGIYEVWSVFVGETPDVSIQGFHLKAADEFGEGVQVSQAFQMGANGLSAIDVQFSTDQPLTLLVRYEVSEIRPPGTFEEIRDAIRTTSGSVTLKRVSGVEWRRISFSSMEGSDKRWFVIRLALIDAVPVDGIQLRSRAAPDRLQPPVGLMISRDNVFGGGALWISDRRQLGSLSLRAFSHRRTAYQRFRADLAPTLPPILRSAAVELTIAVAYQWALLTVLYAVLKSVAISSSTSASGASIDGTPRP
jgi:hypothetical protein